MIGTTLGRYRLLETLGERGRFTTWRADDTLLGRVVALRLLEPVGASSPGARQRFVEHARAASQLEHPGIAGVLGAGEIDGTAFIAYPFIEGESLAARLVRGPLSPPALIRLAQGAADALAHAHECGAIHLALSPHSIVLRSDGAPVIVDFGLARRDVEGELGSLITAFDELTHLAPEQLLGEDADERTDLWSLGVILYESATGHPPFPIESYSAFHRAVMVSRFKAPSRLRSELAPEWDRICRRLLRATARDRPQSARALATELQRVAASMPIAMEAAPAPAETRGHAVRRWWRRLSRRRFGPLQVVYVLAALGLLAAAARFVQLRLTARSELVLAVLPMRVASADTAEAGVVAEALGEELVGRFRATGRLRVLPWISTGRPLAHDTSLTSVAAALHAGVLVAGTVLGGDEGASVRIDLIDGNSGAKRWSREFTAPGGDFAALQNTIVLSTTEQLVGPLNATARARLAGDAPRSAEAYEYFVRGANAWHSSDPVQSQMARPFFERAVELDSTLAGAWVALGAQLTDTYFRGGAADDADLAIADRDFRLALGLRPGMAAAERGLIRIGVERLSPGSIREMLAMAARALDRDANDVDQLMTAALGFTLGEMPELAIPVLDRALELDPGNQALAWYSVVALNWSGHPQRCLAAGANYLRRFGEDLEIYMWMANAAWGLGRVQEAVQLAQRGAELSRDSPGHYVITMLAHLYRVTGDRASFETLMKRVLPDLEARVRATPGNARLTWKLRELYVMMGDERRAASIGASGVEPPAPDSNWEHVAFLGRVRESRALLERLPTDLDTDWDGHVDSLRPRPRSYEPGVLEVMHSPEYRRWREAVDAKQLAAFEQYRQIVARHFPRDPDVPAPRKRWPRRLPS